MEEHSGETADTVRQLRICVALDLGDFIHEVTRDPKCATPESVAALPEVANALNLILCEVR